MHQWSKVKRVNEVWIKPLNTMKRCRPILDFCYDRGLKPMATLKEMKSTYPELQISKQIVHRFNKNRESGDQYEGMKPGSGAQAFKIDEKLIELVE